MANTTSIEHTIVSSHEVDCTKDGDKRRVAITSAMKCWRCGTLMTDEIEGYGVLALSVALGTDLLR